MSFSDWDALVTGRLVFNTRTPCIKHVPPRFFLSSEIFSEKTWCKYCWNISKKRQKYSCFPASDHIGFTIKADLCVLVVRWADLRQNLVSPVVSKRSEAILPPGLYYRCRIGFWSTVALVWKSIGHVFGAREVPSLRCYDGYFRDLISCWLLSLKLLMLDSVGEEGPIIAKDLFLTMDTYVPCGVADPKHISTHDLEQSDVNHEQNTSCNGDDSVTALVDALTGILCLKEVHESLPGQFQPFGSDEICHPDPEMYRELIIDLADSVAGTIQKGLTKSATFPCSKKDSAVDGKTVMACMGSSDTRPACMRSISLPTPSKLVPAIKGSREKQGAPLRKLTVTWAPDVYDPPSTSLSHTVKSCNQQRRRTNKKNGKDKHKGKSSRGSTSDKKQYRSTVSNSDMHSKSIAHKSSRGSTSDKKQYRSSVTNSNLLSKSIASSDELHFGGFSQSSVELVDFVSGQDSKCGSSFLRTSLTKVHMSVAEAT
ncbi:hypothetical protein NE237_010196 [Protea cynaroides]|uniref:Uncharacterized protein n=1 Tax=Protea cynaroides TaxID=273540 RepID=A0A9Q0L041_9MAGN|nr:hypothetical protein NE237_010196 [Protea cynaroides]